MPGYFGQVFTDLPFQFIIEQICLGYGQDSLFVKQFRIVFLEFLQKDFVFLVYIIAVGRNQEKQDGVTFDMPEEADPEAFPFTGPFDDPGNVGHYKGRMVAVLYNSKIWYQGCEGIIGNLRFGGRDGREQG